MSAIQQGFALEPIEPAVGLRDEDVGELLPQALATARFSVAIHGDATAADPFAADGQRAADHRPYRFAAGGSKVLQTCAPLLLSDVLAIALSGLFAAAVMHALRLTLPVALGWASPVALLPLVLAYWPGGLYPGVGLHPVVELRQIVKLNTVAFLGFILACALGCESHRGPEFYSISWVATMVLVPLGRSLVRHAFADRPWWGCPTLLITSADATDRVSTSLARHRSRGLREVAHVDPTGPHRSAADVDALIARRGVRYGVLSLPDCSRDQVMQAIDFYSARLPHLLVLPDHADLPTLWSSPRSCGGALGGTEVRNGLMLPSHRLAKRVMDLALTALGGLLILPLIALIALAIRLTSPGPVIYGHTRIGLGGRRFKAWKFRSMIVHGDEILRAHLANDPAARAEWALDHKLRNDPRVTAIGKLLRKTSLDELPQLWNVWKGEMSLVGPRPIVNDEVMKYGKVFRLYTGVKPGITGLWQVSGRNNTTYDERVALDNWYVRNWSPWLDLYIIGRTFQTILAGDGAY